MTTSFLCVALSVMCHVCDVNYSLLKNNLSQQYHHFQTFNLSLTDSRIYLAFPPHLSIKQIAGAMGLLLYLTTFTHKIFLENFLDYNGSKDSTMYLFILFDSLVTIRILYIIRTIRKIHSAC